MYNPPQRRPRHYPAACFHPSGRDAWETSGWGFSHISLHHDANGRGPGFSGLTRARAIFAASSGKGKGNEAKPNPQWQKAPGHCCEKATEGGQAPELPDSHSGRKRRIKGPTFSFAGNKDPASSYSVISLLFLYMFQEELMVG